MKVGEKLVGKKERVNGSRKRVREGKGIGYDRYIHVENYQKQ